VGSPPSISQCGVSAWLMPASQLRQAYLGRIVTMIWNRAGTISSRSAFAIGLEPMAHQWLTLTDLDHVGAAAEADLVLRLDHHFDAEAG
jgi:hypothetical protein